MGAGEPLGRLPGDLVDQIQGQGPLPDPLVEGLPVEERHGEKRLAVPLVDLVDRADIGMVQRRRGLRLAQEALAVLARARDVLREELQRDDALETGVLGLVDDAHPAFAEGLEDPVAGDRPRFHARADPPYFGASGKN